MPRSPGLCGLILSAGDSTRMGTDKALLSWPPLERAEARPGHTFLSAAIGSLSPFSEMVIVVAGRNAPNLTPIVYTNGAFLVRNPDPDRGQFSSLQVGLQEVLNRGRDAAIITLVDRPPVRPETIEKLRDAFVAAPTETWAMVPQFAGKHGHPYLASRELIEIFLKAPATATARDVEHQYQRHIEYLAVDDPSVNFNVDTPEDYAALVSQINSRS